MSEKVLRLLDSGEFRRMKPAVKAAVLEKAFRDGLLPDADGQWTVLA